MPSAPRYSQPRRLRRKELADSARLSLACFGGDADPEAAEWPSEGEVYVIAGNGRPACQIHLFHSRLRIHDAVMQIGSVGGVCTGPDHRGQGLASRLLDFCAARLKQQGAQLMLISGQRGLYTRVGNVPAGRFAAFDLPRAETGADPGGYRLRPAEETDDALCSRLYAAEPVHFARPRHKFASYLRRQPGGYHAERYLIEDADGPAAYLFLSIPWDEQDRPEPRTRALIEYAGSRLALADGLRQLQGQFQLQAFVPWQDRDLLALLRALVPQRGWDEMPDHTMRILNFPALLEALEPHIDPRLAGEQSGPLLGEEGRCAVSLGAERLELPVAEMTQLVLGSAEPAAPSGPDRSGPDAPGLRQALAANFPLPAFLTGLDFH